MRILVTGSRTWIDVNTIGVALYEAIEQTAHREVTIVHGACPQGADRIAADFCESEAAWLEAADTSLIEEPHPARWRHNGVLDRSAGFRRNAEMVALGADICLAFIRGGSRGATHTADLAEKAGIPVRRWTT